MSTFSIKRRIGRFSHVVVVLWTSKKCTCFAHNSNCLLTLLLLSSSWLLVLPNECITGQLFPSSVEKNFVFMSKCFESTGDIAQLNFKLRILICPFNFSIQTTLLPPALSPPPSPPPPHPPHSVMSYSLLCLT